jgi:sterol desaturase/sphingolipid hydroxylase (fatty acid hydroxylase superfamily)
MAQKIISMENLLLIFENISSVNRALIIVSGITFFWVIEGITPFKFLDYKKWRHSIPNFLLTLTTIIVNFFFAFLLVFAADWTNENNFGIIHLADHSIIINIILGLLVLDLIGAYLPHLVQHKVKLLWYIHIVHHTDHKVDTTTANRHHPFESVVRFLFTFIGIFVSGAPIGLVLMYQSISVIASQFNHANIQISNKVDKLISYIIVSPNMHKVHHHFELPYTDSNYGNIFSIWDRLFGTYMELNKDKIVYGVDTDLDEIKNSKFTSLLERPFKKWYNHFN